MKHALLMFDVYANTSHQDSIMGLIRRYRTEEKIEELYAPEYRQYIQPHIFAKVREYLLNKSNPDQYDLYWLGLMAQRDGDFLKSAHYFEKSILSGNSSPHTYRNLVRSLTAATGADADAILRKLSTRTLCTKLVLSEQSQGGSQQTERLCP